MPQWASMVAQLVKLCTHAGDPGSNPGSGRSPEEGIGYPLQYSWTSLVAQLVKNPLAMWENWIRSLGWEDPLEEGGYLLQYFWSGEFHCTGWKVKVLVTQLCPTLGL